jgi:mannose-6-phosphate isomerase-like protein (cupin superfamily)
MEAGEDEYSQVYKSLLGGSGGYYDNIDVEAKKNTNLHKDIYSWAPQGTTSALMNITLTHLDPKQETGMKTRSFDLQVVKGVEGVGLVIIGGATQVLNPGMMLVIPPNVSYNIINVSAKDPLKMYTTHVLSVPQAGILDSMYSAIWGGLPTEMHEEVAFQGDVKDYIRMCQTDKAHLKRCMVPGHWQNYMRGKSMEDAILILRFALSYVEEHPRLFKEVSQEFTNLFAKEIEMSKEGLSFVKAKGKGKAKAAKAAKATPTDVKGRKYKTMLSKLAGHIRDVKIKLLRIEYYVEKLGPISDILNTPLAKSWMMLDIFVEKILSIGEKTDNEVRAEFLTDFISDVKIKDRSLDVEIAGLFVQWKIEDEPQIEDEDEDEDDFVFFFDNYLESYIDNNASTSIEKLIIVENLVQNMKNEDSKERILRVYQDAAERENRPVPPKIKTKPKAVPRTPYDSDSESEEGSSEVDSDEEDRPTAAPKAKGKSKVYAKGKAKTVPRTLYDSGSGSE